MTAEVFLPPILPPAVRKRLLLQCEGLKQRLSETVFPLLRKTYVDSRDKRKRITWSPFRLSVSICKLSETDSFIAYAETVSVFRKGRRLFFETKEKRIRIKDGKYLPPKKEERKRKKAKSEEKPKKCWLFEKNMLYYVMDNASSAAKDVRKGEFIGG